MIQSIKTNQKGIVLILISSIMACGGQLLWKMSASNGLIFLVIGFLLYGLGAVTMLIAYRYGSVSVLQPLMSVGYIFSTIAGYLVLNEEIYIEKIIGIVCIIIGVIFIAGGDD